MRKSIKNSLKVLELLKKSDPKLEEVGKPINFNWNKCKLETISFGHGITTTHYKQQRFMHLYQMVGY